MEGQVLPPYTAEQKATAFAAIARVDELADKCGSFISGLETNFVHLGKALHEVKTNEHWMVVGFSSFPTYMKASVEPRVKRKRAILYAYMGAAEDLLQYVPENELVEMGITKAMALRQLIKAGVTPTPELIQKATDKTVTRHELDALIAGELHAQPDEPGRYVSLGAVKFTEDEYEEFMHGANIALQTDPPVNIGGAAEEWSDLPPHAQKEVLWRWNASYLVENEAIQRASGLNLRQTEKSSGSSEASEQPSSPSRGSKSESKRKRSKNSAGISSSPPTASASDAAAG